MFVPSAGAVLVDWGAEVLKIEHPTTGDPQRGLITSGLVPGGPDGVNFMVEQPNRGKQSVAIDIGSPDGHEALMKMVETADVFLTNYMPGVRRKLGIDLDDIRARNSDIIIARGTGQGPKGPDAEKGGYDGASFWARGGLASISAECITKMDEAFGSQPLSHWKKVLDDFAGVWTPFQTLDELYEDPQVIANGYLPSMTASNGSGCPTRGQSGTVR